MKRVILTSLLTAAGLLAQSTGTPQTPANPDSKTTTKKKHRRSKKSTDKKTGTQASSQPSAPAKQ